MADKVSMATLALAKEYTDTHGGGGGLTTQANWTQTDTTADDYIKNKPTLGDLAGKDSASGSITPSGSISVSQGTDATETLTTITAAGTLPSFSVDEEVLIFNAGVLPTTENKTVVTASGTRTATFTGTEDTVTVE